MLARIRTILATGVLALLPFEDSAQSPPVPQLKVSDNGRFLVRADATPFFWLGDSAQTLFYRLNREDAEFYLRHRAKLGFNVIETQLISFLGLAATNQYGHTPFKNNNPLQPNEPFWEHVDSVIDKAASLGLFVALVPDRTLIVNNDSYSNGRWAHGPFDETDARAYGRYVGRRFAAKPVVWMFGWDIHPSGREAMYSALAKGIAEGAAAGEQDRVLISFQPSPALVGLWQHASSSHWFHQRDWLDFNSLQSGHTDDNESYGLAEVHTLVQKDYALHPPKPVIDLEPAYENTPDGIWNGKRGPRMGAEVMRRKAYWAVFAGAAGHTYGHSDIVAFHKPGRPDFSAQEHFWKEVLDAPGATQMRHVRTLIESRPPMTRVPDQSILVSDAGRGLAHVRAMRSSDGTYAFAYIPDGRPIKVHMKRLGAKEVRAAWFDPRTGAFTPIGRFENTGAEDFDPPGSTALGNDWVLVLDAL